VSTWIAECGETKQKKVDKVEYMKVSLCLHNNRVNKAIHGREKYSPII
jgi:hypothetical protein